VLEAATHINNTTTTIIMAMATVTADTQDHALTLLQKLPPHNPMTLPSVLLADIDLARTQCSL